MSSRFALVAGLVWLAPQVALAQDDLLAPLAPSEPAKPKPKPKAKPKAKPVHVAPKARDEDLLAPLAKAKTQLWVKIPGGAATDAVFALDGTPMGALPDHAIDVSAGEHTVVVKRPGYVDYSQKIMVSEGQTAEMTAALERTAVAAVEPAPTPPLATDRPERVDLHPADHPSDVDVSIQSESSPHIYQRWYFWTGAAVVVAAGVVTAVAVASSKGGAPSPTSICGGTCAYVMNGP